MPQQPLKPTPAAEPGLPRRRGRPPRNPGTPGGLDTRAQLLRSGVAVLTEKGYSAVGIDELLRAAQVPKGSFYYYFSSKEAFGQALIEAYAAYFARKLDRCLLDTRVSPLARLRLFVDDAKAGMARHGFRRGCLVGNLGQEMGTLPESFRAQLEQVFVDWQQRTACLAEAQAGGDIGPQHDAPALARFFWIGWEGAVLRAKLQQAADPLDDYAAGFFALLAAPR
ncbi:acrylate utilization transcriptional regulator AcuR [Aquabacterium sp. OR-4]|uniref:acrylate utilization transcriptional regulator AcuR n=1 Tax=Aquabacterium sp. OR-4 TaxID=2978127 RepID=UPI0028C5C63F|nr:TetR/AcrR family transcriptional regulator [Aquabacterium sp. OR-4]MDT7835099.1 TetR/AcrR family transcriptional regulator [Aquabacterium sp. OR-4]